MADGPTKKPRIRKTAPTVRELTQAQTVEEKPGRLKRATGKVPRVKLPGNPVTRTFGKFFRGIGRLLRWIIPNYFVNSWKEIRLVTWPSRKESWRLTGAVFVFAIVFGALVAVVDKGLDEIFKKLILK